MLTKSAKLRLILNP